MTYLSVLAPGLPARPLLEWATAFRDQAIVMSDVEAYEVAHGNPFDWNLKEVSEALGPLLHKVCKSSAGVKLKSVSKIDGFNTWRVLAFWFQARSTNDSMSLLTMIMNPDRAKDLGDMMIKLDRWDALIRDCEMKTEKDDISDKMRQAALFSSSPSSCLSSWPPTSSSTMWRTNTLCTSANEDLGTLAEYDPLTGYEPNDYHFSETTEPDIQESSGENGSLNDLQYDDSTIGMALSSPVFTQEREGDASRRRAYHSHDRGLSSSQSSSSVGHRTGRPVVEQFDSQIPNVRENPRHSSENEQIRILLERQRELILADCQAEIQKHELQADFDRRSIQKLNEVIESQRGEINRALEGDEQLRRDQLFHEQSLEQGRELREAHVKSLNEMEELKRFQRSTFEKISRRKIDRRL